MAETAEFLGRSENIRVVARFRPVNEREKDEWTKFHETKYDGLSQMPVVVKGSTITIENSTDKPYRFTFDQVLWTNSTQEETFEVIAAPVCRQALNGFNGTIFAYGQTGSGKTHTIIGPEDKFSPQDSGLVPRAANFFFHAIENAEDIESCDLRVSFLEIYRGELRDLNPIGRKNGNELKIRQRVSGDTYVENLNLVPVESLSELLRLITIANSHRTMAATSMNKTSSRSHSIMTFYLKIKKTQESGGHQLKAQVNFVDLAGSEKVKKTGAQGQRLKEAQAINVGLSTLARVVEALVKKRNVVPFRDSMLTWILKDSLVGNTKTTLVVACSPHRFNCEETVSTCRFASRCKLIKTHVVSNKELTPQQMKALIKKLQQENAKLRDNVPGADDEENNARVKRNDERMQSLETEKEELEKKIQELEAIQTSHADCEQTIKNLELENERLRGELAKSDREKRDLAILQTLVAEKLNEEKDKSGKARKEALNAQLLAELATQQKEELKGQKKDLIQQLKELKFSSQEAEKIYQNAFKEYSSIVTELDERNKELETLREKSSEQEDEIEKRGAEIQQLREQLLSLTNQTNPVETEEELKSDFPKYHATTFTLRNGAENIDSLLEEQEKYLNQVADKDEEEWKRKEQQAWEQFMDQKAKEQGFKDAKELLKQRRLNAKNDLKAGKIEEMPTDAQLLNDLREEFEQKYDPITGKVKDRPDEEKSIILNAPPIDENETDDPWLWDSNDVETWLTKTLNLNKYAQVFKREGIDGRTLLVDITPVNLKRDLQIKSVHVEKIMRGVKELRDLSPAYQEWAQTQGLGDDGPKIVVNQNEVNIDAEEDENDNEVWELTEEEKKFGEQFWALDELFKILDVRGTGTLDLAVFKHGLHALGVELTDEEMDGVFRQIDTENKGVIEYRSFMQFLQFTDLLPPQSRKYVLDILAAMPRVAHNRRQYVTRAAMVIKYAIRYNNTKSDINNYLLNKGLTRAEIDAAWKQYRFNPKAIADIEFRGIQMKKGKLIEMAIKDKSVQPFDDYHLYKLLRRAGNKNYGSEEFSDLDYLRAAGSGARVHSIKFWFDPNSQFFNGFQFTYECSNGQQLKSGKNFVGIGQYVEEEMIFHNDEFITSISVYFAHFISAVQIDTNRLSKIFGVGSDKNTNPHNITQTLVAPQGSAIMAFYGSYGRLFETLGCYCVTFENIKAKKSMIRKSKVKSSKHVVSNSGNQGNTQTDLEAETEVTATQEPTQNEESEPESKQKPQPTFFKKLISSSK